MSNKCYKEKETGSLIYNNTRCPHCNRKVIIGYGETPKKKIPILFISVVPKKRG